MKIREASTKDISTIAMLIRESHRDVAAAFALTSDNCPRHPSFCTEAWVEADYARGERYLILEAGAVPVACVAYESPNTELVYLNRLSVLPAFRRRGYGALLVHQIIQLARTARAGTISIGVIGEHHDLQRWYGKLGFTAGESKRFAHLPFSVRYMTYAVPVIPSSHCFNGPLNEPAEASGGPDRNQRFLP